MRDIYDFMPNKDSKGRVFMSPQNRRFICMVKFYKWNWLFEMPQYPLYDLEIDPNEQIETKLESVKL